MGQTWLWAMRGVRFREGLVASRVSSKERTEDVFWTSSGTLRWFSFRFFPIRLLLRTDGSEILYDVFALYNKSQ